MSWVVTTAYFTNYHAGFGLWNFAADSIGYHEEAIRILSLLKNGDYSGWCSGSNWWHVYLIALSYGAITAHPLSFAPINAAAWTTSVLLVHRSTKQILPLRPKISVVSALIFGLCPSYLLNSTQLLKEPFYVMGMVMVVYGWIAMLSGNRSCVYGFIVGLGAMQACLSRWYITESLILLSLIALVFVIWNSPRLFANALLAFMLVVGAYFLSLERSDKSGRTGILNEARKLKIEVGIENKSESGKPNNVSLLIPRFIEDRLLMILWMRSAFASSFSEAGSNIDTHVHLRTAIDLFCYIPRALKIGFLAPFPNQWFREAKNAGRISRLVAGLEMAGWYFLLPGFVFFVFMGAPAMRIRFWLIIFSVSLVLLTAFLVTNIGALMRMRFVYFLPILIGGLEGWSGLSRWKKNNTSQKGIQKAVCSADVPLKGTRVPNV